MLRNAFALLLMGAVLSATAAAAQDSTMEPEDDGLGSPGGDASGMAAPADDPALLGDDQALAEERIGVEEQRDETDPFEDPSEGYYFVGLFYRHTFVPEFILNLFTEDATAASNPAFGAEFTYRKDGFDIVGSLWYAGWSVNGPFRGSGDPETDTEWIDSEIKTIFISGAFLWSTPFNDVFALEYGVDIGIGVVFGSLDRTEAYPNGDGWAACNGVGNPNPAYCDGPPITGECDGTGGHYCEEPQWSGGGSVPNVVPWLAIPHIALRIKPIKQFMMRIEGGFGLGFFLGGSASYGF